MKSKEVKVLDAFDRSKITERKTYWYKAGIVCDEYDKYFEVPFYKVKTEDSSNYIVKASEEGRLDLISYKIYGTVDYWWVIAIANDIYFPLDVKAGDVLLLPPKYYIEQVLLRWKNG